MDSTGTIEANGQHYDIVNASVADIASAPPLHTAGRNIDGFFRTRTTTTPTTRTPQPKADSITSLIHTLPSAPEVNTVNTLKRAEKPKPLSHRVTNHARVHTPQPAKPREIHVSHENAKTQTFTVRRGPANHAQRRALQRSKTLRRDAVSAPELSTHNTLKPKGVLQHAVPGLITVKKSVAAVDSDRLARAQSTPKSQFVAHHAAPARNILPLFAPVTVQPVPTPSAVPTPMPGNGGTPAVPPPRPTNEPTPTDIFEHALTNANHFVDIRAHKARYRQKARFHIASMAVGTLALVVIAGFVAYQNSPSLQIKVASLKAGVSARIPNLAAVGLAYNGVRAGDGNLTLGLKGQGGNYQLTQANTDLSDADMIQTIGVTNASGTPVYQVVLAGSTVVYRFGNNNATWVSNGKWYTLTGTNAISDSQVETIVQHV